MRQLESFRTSPILPELAAPDLIIRKIQSLSASAQFPTMSNQVRLKNLKRYRPLVWPVEAMGDEEDEEEEEEEENVQYGKNCLSGSEKWTSSLRSRWSRGSSNFETNSASRTWARRFPSSRQSVSAVQDDDVEDG
eukprot:767031-Hanusia_phi.AAC.2